MNEPPTLPGPAPLTTTRAEPAPGRAPYPLGYTAIDIPSKLDHERVNASQEYVP
jgi:hypothetical protein